MEKFGKEKGIDWDGGRISFGTDYIFYVLSTLRMSYQVIFSFIRQPSRNMHHEPISSIRKQRLQVVKTMVQQAWVGVALTTIF